MKRALLIFGCVLSACGSVERKDYPRPFACDHNGGDGGVQCAKGWRCGFDDRCFDEFLDGGQLVTQWQCANALHCPPLWQCSQEVDSIRNCQQLGVGAPTRCLDDDAGCQGGWRCAATERCFNPTDVDGGTSRDCVRDGECPNGYLCGEAVDDEQKCIQQDAGADSRCNTDRGCQGGWRCNTVTNRCVPVNDVITLGHTGTVVNATERNARVSEPAPLLLAVTRSTTLPPLFAPTVTSNRDGILIARLFADGGVRVTAQFHDEHQDQGNTALYEVTYGIGGAASDVTDLALSFDGPVVRFSDGTTRRMLFDGGANESIGPTDFLRQRDGLGPGLNQSGLVRVNGRNVLVDGMAPVPFPGFVGEVVVLRDTIFALTDAGFYATNSPPDGGFRLITQGAGQPILLGGPSRGVVAGLIDGMPGQPQVGLIAEVALPDGGAALRTVAEHPLAWGAMPLIPACPDGSNPIQLSFDVDPNGTDPMAFTRCRQADGGTYPVQVSDGMFQGVIEDQAPFQWGVVSQRASPLVRAHAGTDGRVWLAVDEGQNGQLGRFPLRPLILDRQPETMLSFRDPGRQTVRLFAEAAGRIFAADTNGGLVSQVSSGDIVALSIVTGHSGWVLMSTGVIANDVRPTLIAVMPAGVSLVAPASAVLVQLQLGARLRDVVLVASGDTIWVADVSDAQGGQFSQPAQFERVLVPVPGVRLRSMTVTETTTTSVSGYLTTSTQNLSFGTSDLVRWSLTPVATPVIDALPLEVWSEPDGGAGRTAFNDGRIWSLPIMVPLTTPLPLPDGGVAIDGGSLRATDFGRLCGDVFAATSKGIFRAQASDGGLPSWVALPTVNTALLSKESLRLYETHDDVDRLFVGTQLGQVVELITTCQ